MNASSSAIRVLVADDDPIVRSIVGRLLRRQPGLELVGEAVDGAETVARCRELHPDLLLLDLLMPQVRGLDALRELTAGDTGVRVIVLCASIGKRQIVQALNLGARGVLLKQDVARLGACIQAVMDGDYWVEDRRVTSLADVIGRLLDPTAAESASAAGFRLTKRELQVTSLVTLGKTNREIGQALSISEETVKRHLANIFDKIGTSSRLELAMFAVDHELTRI